MKNLLTSTATVIALTASAAYAESHTAAFSEMTFDEAMNLNASELIGKRVYASEADIENNSMIAEDGEKEWDDIGEINEIVLTRDGQVQNVVVGVGGFLGMGEKDVAIAMDQLRFVMEEGEDDPDDYFLVVNASAAGVEDAPEYRSNRMDDDMDDEMDDAAQEAETEMNELEVQTESEMNEAEAEIETEMNEAEAEVETEMNEAEAELETVEAETEQELAEADAEMERLALTRPAVEREGYADVAYDDLTTEDLTGANVYGANDEDIGEVSELILSEDGKIEQAVLDIGGFLGLGEHSVAVPMDELQIIRDEAGMDLRVYIESSQEALEAQPEYEG
ncbi:PRC-barrel domain-containing protein [Thalassorhabdomicrobium marinisediminis]|uniref:PRC-barrel domain-containing protein n=1 Tax=Thalassorhabdomicrobium marinisediminis TaxID=2170577 RepID=UPI00249091AA|nr:PRC-barrel domain-containing protein [Thalassorhabdomicrobium marinisediminis]